MRLFPHFVAEETVKYGGRVRVLPPEVAHRIAAGEVIERPASAVKELVENTLDAGATRVEVDTEDGGISLVRVRDDGHGMAADDAERAVAEHATSKIQTADDLARVESSGFRGEALHAIGSVSHLTLTTNGRGTEGPSFRVGVRAGEVIESGPASHPPGTTVEARELFLNLPVCRGFLGTVRAEAKPVATTPLQTSPAHGDEGRHHGEGSLPWGPGFRRRGSDPGITRLGDALASAWWVGYLGDATTRGGLRARPEQDGNDEGGEVMTHAITKEELPHVIAKEDLPYGTIAHRFEGHRYGDVGVSFFLVDCPPEGGAVLHTHPYEEVFVTLEGEATFTVGDDTIEVGAGQVVVAPAGVPHKFVNTGTGPLRQVDIHPSGRIRQDNIPGDS